MNELLKTTFQLLCSFIIAWLIELSLKIPEKLEKEFSLRLEKGDKKKIQKI